MNHKGRCVCWTGKDYGWKVGHIIAPDGIEVYRNVFDSCGENLVQHSQTLEIEWVPCSLLKEYTGAEGTAYA